MSTFFRISLSFWLLVGANVLQADPLAPGLWAIEEITTQQTADTQTEKSLYQITWKRALKSEPGFFPSAQLPSVCTDISPRQTRIEGTARLQTWQSACEWLKIQGQSFEVSGLTGSQVGVLLRISTLSGEHYHRMLSGEHNTYKVPPKESALAIFENYLVSGFEHLLTGLDHVLFVILLALLVGWQRKLIVTITLFTLGHSLTLSLTIMGLVSFPSALVETLIAFSIVLAAAELAQPDKLNLFATKPGWMSGGFGLLHGMGFAGALSQVGLPSGEIPLALAAFNIGIELGQLLVIGALFVLVIGTQRLLKSQWINRSLADRIWPQFQHEKNGTLGINWITLLTAYSIGAIAALWFWQRLLGY